MLDKALAGATLVISHQWAAGTELASVTRSIAGAATRFGDVAVMVPGQSAPVMADGAFDLLGIDLHAADSAGALTSVLGRPVSDFRRVIVDQVEEDTAGALQAFESTSLFLIEGEGSAEWPGRSERLAFLPDRDGSSEWLGMHVPVNPLAATHRHNGLGFTGYVLVLSDRHGTPSPNPPTDTVAWVTAGLHQTNVVVVEGGSAAVWQGRALRGVVPVETRTDLWRLFAHAQCVVDLAAGPVIATECVESLRFGTPIVVPATSTAAAHARSGGGAVYSSIDELLQGLDAMADPSSRALMSTAGKQYADTYFGDAAGFVLRLAARMAST